MSACDYHRRQPEKGAGCPDQRGTLMPPLPDATRRQARRANRERSLREAEGDEAPLISIDP